MPTTVTQRLRSRVAKHHRSFYPSGAKKGAARGIARSGAIVSKEDSSIKIMNTKVMKPLFVERTLDETLTLTVAGSTIPATTMVFDPSGLYGNTSFGRGGLTMTDWASCTGLYNFYRVKYVKIIARYHDSTLLSSNINYPLWLRYNYEPSVTVPSLAGVTSLSRVMLKTFTKDKLTVSYTLYPKVAFDLQNGAILASQGKGMKSQPWTDVNFPAQLYGFQMISDETLPPNATIFFEITYGVQFKYSK